MVAFAQKPKRTKHLIFSPKNFKTFRCTHRLQLWEVWQKVHAKNPIISLNEQKTWAKFLHSRETSRNCSSEHFESSFDNPASNFNLIVQTFLLEVRRYFKKRFFYKFFPPIFSVLVGRFFATMTFLSKTKKIAQIPKQMNEHNFS